MDTGESAPTSRTVYRIPNWQKQFENSRTRGINSLNYLNWSNRFDSDSYVDIIAGPDGPLHWGVYSAICMVASMNEPAARGMVLREDGEPHTAETLAEKTRIPLQVMSDALDRLTKLKRLERMPFVTNVAQMPQLVNGGARAEKPVSAEDKHSDAALVPLDQDFEAWSIRWFEATKQRNHETAARKEWLRSVALLTDRTAFHECTRRYLESAQVKRGEAIMNRHKWLAENAKENWTGQWAPPKVDAKSAGVAESVEQHVRQNVAKGQRPL